MQWLLRPLKIKRNSLSPLALPFLSWFSTSGNRVASTRYYNISYHGGCHGLTAGYPLLAYYTITCKKKCRAIGTDVVIVGTNAGDENVSCAKSNTKVIDHMTHF